MTGWPSELNHDVIESDCEDGGAISEQALVGVFLRARHAYVQALGLSAGDAHFRVWDLRLKILRPVRAGDRLVVRAQIDEIRSRSLRVRYLVFDGRTDAFAAEGSSMLVPIGAAGQDRDVSAAFISAVEAAEGRRFTEEP
jgi:acyl-CoA thioesterase FadM